MKLLNDMFLPGKQPESGHATTDGAPASIQIRLNADHLIYTAHVPGNPITPGVCLVQALGELLCLQTGRKLRLSRIVNLKFVSTISPVEHAVVTVNFTQIENVGNTCKAKGCITAEDDKVMTKFSIIYQEEE